ncbi:MAG: threonine--tRNA ligase [Phycisphaerales bacterium]|nr:threonine--tRNA ligase [Phycisphaerales bacterium]
MLKVRLPDGQVVEHPDGSSAADVLAAVAPGLARRAVAARVNDQVIDLHRPLPGPEVELVALTLDDPAGLEVARHSCAHVMAEAICALWPQTKLAYGPPVENGFYYDMELDHPLTPEDFARIEAKMAEIVKEDRPFTRYEVPRAAALQKLSQEGNPYKLDNAERAGGDVLSFYVTGSVASGCFEDLCRGPHVPSSGKVGAFKVMQVSGAYWHGDATKQQLQRVYGTTWPDRKALRMHLDRLEEARKRDHRKIGQELGLFLLDASVGTGLVLWKPRGAVLRRVLESFILEELLRRGYQSVYTPHIGKLDLYRTSGHFPYYKDSQYPPLYESDRARQLNRLWELARASNAPRASTAELELFDSIAAEHADLLKAGYPIDLPMEERLRRIRNWLSVEDGYLLRPMNCPHHVRIYASEPRSYRDLPVRLAEFGQVYRYEQSGEVNGMTRVRGFCQDDAHIFCTPAQLQDEIIGCVEMAELVLRVIGLTDYRVRIGLRDDSDKYIGSRENWTQAEAAVREAVRRTGMQSTEARGEAAFYGPKIDFVVKDCLGRDWQLGTVQVDYNLPERFQLTYIGDDNAEHRPIMVHRAPFGSFERFVGILIEHFAGAFPLWLAPIQVRVCSISEKSSAYARAVYEALRAASVRVEIDESGDRISAKIRNAALLKIPYILVVGEQEAADQTVNVRTRDGKQYGSFSLPEFLAACAQEIATRGQEIPAAAGQATAP